MVMSLVGCGDMLTWAAEAKRQGIEQYNDGRYAEAAVHSATPPGRTPSIPKRNIGWG